MYWGDMGKSGPGVFGDKLLCLLRMVQNRIAERSANTASPPIAPPAIAPTRSFDECERDPVVYEGISLVLVLLGS